MKYIVAFIFTGILAASGIAAPMICAQSSNVKAIQSAGGFEPACMNGRLIEKVAGKNNQYVFENKTGIMTLTIAHELFGNETITETTPLRICGKLDYTMALHNAFDVESISIVK